MAAGRAREPRWITRQMLAFIHQAQMREHGGRPGVRDEGLIDSALARPRNKYTYAKPGLGALAAAYTFGLAKNHGFIDGNKRTAFLAAYVFLELNGHDLDATELEVVAAIDAVAASEMSEVALAKWFAARLRPRK